MTRVRDLFQKSLKNRSSKHLRFMTGPGTKPAIWGWSNECLRAQAAECKDANNPYDRELNRRHKKCDKAENAKMPA